MREHEGQPGGRIGAEAADEMRIGHRHRGLEESEHRFGRGEPRDRGAIGASRRRCVPAPLTPQPRPI